MGDLYFGQLNEEQKERIRGAQRALGESGVRRLDVAPARPRQEPGYQYFPAVDEGGNVLTDEEGKPLLLYRRRAGMVNTLKSLFGTADVERWDEGRGRWVIDVTGGAEAIKRAQQVYDRYGSYDRAIRQQGQRGQ